MPPAAHEYHYRADVCPRARAFLETFIRWTTFCERYEPAHCMLAADIIRRVADANRR